MSPKEKLNLELLELKKRYKHKKLMLRNVSQVTLKTFNTKGFRQGMAFRQYK